MEEKKEEEVEKKKVVDRYKKFIFKNFNSEKNSYFYA